VVTEDELLAQIQETDPDACIRVIDGQRILQTTALERHVVVYLNPQNMRIVHLDAIDGSGAHES
jgi:hypothetical protein